jgi:hypothetical protein
MISLVPITSCVISAENDTSNVWHNFATEGVQQARRTQRPRFTKCVYFNADRREATRTTDMSSVCKYCDRTIYWAQSRRTQKYYPIDNENDKTSFHSKTCTGLER